MWKIVGYGIGLGTFGVLTLGAIKYAQVKHERSLSRHKELRCPDISRMLQNLNRSNQLLTRHEAIQTLGTEYAAKLTELNTTIDTLPHYHEGGLIHHVTSDSGGFREAKSFGEAKRGVRVADTRPEKRHVLELSRELTAYHDVFSQLLLTDLTRKELQHVAFQEQSRQNELMHEQKTLGCFIGPSALA